MSRLEFFKQVLLEMEPREVARRLKASGRWDKVFPSSSQDDSSTPAIYGVFKRRLGDWAGQSKFHGIHTDLEQAKAHAAQLAGQPGDHYNDDVGMVAKIKTGIVQNKHAGNRDYHGHLVDDVVGGVFPWSISRHTTDPNFPNIEPNKFHNYDDLPHKWYQNVLDDIKFRD